MFMFIAALKICTADIYLLRDYLMCTFERCHDTGFFKAAQVGGLVVLLIFSLFLFNLYRNFAQDRRQKEITPEQAHLSFWANLSMTLVMVLIFWLAAPWAGYLTVGHVPQLFMSVPWQNLAMINIAVLLVGFWKLEDCIWIYNPKEKTKKYQTSVWTAKDTLWVAVVLFCIALAFSYASNDVLSEVMPQRSGHLQIDLNSIDFSAIGPGFSPSPQR